MPSHVGQYGIAKSILLVAFKAPGALGKEIIPKAVHFMFSLYPSTNQQGLL